MSRSTSHHWASFQRFLSFKRRRVHKVSGESWLVSLEWMRLNSAAFFPCCAEIGWNIEKNPWKQSCPPAEQVATNMKCFLIHAHDLCSFLMFFSPHFPRLKVFPPLWLYLLCVMWKNQYCNLSLSVTVTGNRCAVTVIKKPNKQNAQWKTNFPF